MTSLSDIIIYYSENEVAEALQNGVFKLDEIDEYGYTPLIQTAIINSAEKAKLLLEAGAKADFPDLTGRTALHWCVSNNNLTLCKLLLSYKANANAYTYAGQPVLVMPYLKGYKAIKNTLILHGADLNFAQDFINAKLLGHRYGLEGRCDITDPTPAFFEIELEGFYLEFTLEIIVNSLIEFKKNYGGRELRPLFSQLEIVIESLQIAANLAKYQHYLTNVENYSAEIDRLLNYRPLTLPIAFSGHAVTFIHFTDFLIRCDRGAYGKEHGTVIFYKINNPKAFSTVLIKSLLYKKQNRDFINEGLITQLDLETVAVLPLLPQKSGNCTWANVEAVIPTLMLILLQADKQNDPKDCEQKALHFYKEWREWDKNRALHFCLESFNSAGDARKAAKATLLAAILFQQCEYENLRDLPKAQKIFEALAQPKFRYVLDSYLKVFSKDTKSPIYKNLINYMDDFGVFSLSGIAED